jgi:hypothetical protein
VHFFERRGLCICGWSEHQKSDRKELAESHVLILAEIPPSVTISNPC